jgi:hypothetical protein
MSLTDVKALLRQIELTAGKAAHDLLKALTVDADWAIPLGLNATAAEINRAADVSARVVTIVATGAITEAANEGKINLLGEVGGDAIVTLTLPASTGGGARYKFYLSVANTSTYVIQKAGSDVFTGMARIWDMDAATTESIFDAVGTSSSDVFTWNAGTTGGYRIGDWVEFVDILAGFWAVESSAHCPTSSNPATPFS